MLTGGAPPPKNSKSSNWSSFKPSGNAWRFGKCDQSQNGQSNLLQRRCPASLGIPRQTLRYWNVRYLAGVPEALADKPSRPHCGWNCIPDAVQGRIIDQALEVPELSPCEVAMRFTHQESYVVSEASSIACSNPAI